MKAFAGEFDGTGTVHTEGGDAPVTAHQTGKMILGGRFLQLDSHFTVGSMEVTMMEVIGYDPSIKKFVHIAVEDDNSRISRDTGDHDAAKKRLSMSGVDDHGGGKEQKFHYFVSDVVDGAFKYDYYLDEPSGEKHVLEITLKKK